MKKSIHLIALITVFLLSFQLNFAQRLTFQPQHPLPGEKIKLSYDASDGPFETSITLEATATLYEFGKVKAIEVPLTKTGKIYTGEIPTTSGNLLISVNLTDPDNENRTDNNDAQGWNTMLYNSDRQKPVQYAYSGYSSFYQSKPDKQLAFLEKEFELYPDSKKEEKIITSYAVAAKKSKNEALMNELRKMAQANTSLKKATEKELLWAMNVYKSLDDALSSKEVMEMLRKKHPKGLIDRLDMETSFRESKDLAAKMEIFNRYKAKYGSDPNNHQTVDNFASTIIGTLANEDRFKEIYPYLEVMNNKATKASTLNSIAWDLCGEGLVNEAKNIEKAKEFSLMSVSLIEEELAKPTSTPAYMTEKRWKNNLNYSYAMFSDTYAVIAYRTGDAKTALKYQEIAMKELNGDIEMQERYCLYLEKAKGGKEAEATLEKLLLEGNANLAMKEQHKRLFLANNTVESAYNKFVTSVDARAEEAKRQEMLEKMLDENAPDFSLVNLEGAQVSLAELKGKVVVVDFWATWCGPCKASFPGMQMAVNKYKSSDDVVFLFVDTWENAGDKKKNAADFIASKKYTFNVLLDNESTVVSKFGVSGIPTKFVIDKMGKIRFKSVGFNGNDDELLKEMSLMVELAGGTAPGARP